MEHTHVRFGGRETAFEEVPGGAGTRATVVAMIVLWCLANRRAPVTRLRRIDEAPRKS